MTPLNAGGKPTGKVQRFDLQPLYQPLRAMLGEIDGEGAMLIGDEFVLLNRGLAGRDGNAVARYRLRDLTRVIQGGVSEGRPISVRRYELGAVAGVELGFTDGAALPDGGWVFTAVAESTADSVADGACTGSAVGVVDARGALLWMRRLAQDLKVEGIDTCVADGTTTICMVTDSDDPAQASWMLLAPW